MRRGHEAPRGQELSTQARDSEAALRQEGGLEQSGHASRADRGKDKPQGPADRGQPEEARGKVSAQDAAAFAKSLADHAADAPPADAASQQVEAGPVVDREPEPLLGPEEGQEQDMREVKRNEALRKGPKEMGGTGDLEDPEAPTPYQRRDDGGVRAVRPAARAGLLDLAALLAEAEEAGILFGYQMACVGHEVARLNHRDFDRLRRLLADQPSRMHQATLLKGLAAHRHLDDLDAFSARIAEADEDSIVAPQRDAPRAQHPADLETLGQLRRTYDPISCLEGHDATDAEQPAEGLPRWLRGLPRQPVELALVALQQALTDDLDPDEPTDDGTSAALTRAWRPHGATHPGLERWLLRLAAEAEDEAGLRRALGLLGRTRDTCTKEPAG